jgi:putative phosphoribosyl transferase
MRDVRIPAGGDALRGILDVPDAARGIVLFAHGSGSNRNSPRNQLVAEALRQAGLGTLLMDLLTEEEAESDLRTSQLRFDVELLAARVTQATKWLREDTGTASLRIGYFGASTGAGAMFIAAAGRPDAPGAIVSRGGRPDLAGEALERVTAPTLLIVGSEDPAVLRLNHLAFERIRAEKRLEIIPGATHLFEEPGALDEVAVLAGDWFLFHLEQRAMPASS